MQARDVILSKVLQGTRLPSNDEMHTSKSKHLRCVPVTAPHTRHSKYAATAGLWQCVHCRTVWSGTCCKPHPVEYVVSQQTAPPLWPGHSQCHSPSMPLLTWSLSQCCSHSMSPTRPPTELPGLITLLRMVTLMPGHSVYLALTPHHSKPPSHPPEYHASRKAGSPWALSWAASRWSAATREAAWLGLCGAKQGSRAGQSAYQVGECVLMPTRCRAHSGPRTILDCVHGVLQKKM
jgi:hypothetical protein